MKKTPFTFILITITIVSLQSCLKDHIQTDIDKLLYTELLQSGFTYYHNGEVLAGAAASPHGSFKLRFNAIAKSALDNTGALPKGSSFPNGSVIVKEITTGSSIELYAVMKKDSTNIFAASGWLWAELQPNGSAAYSAVKRGGECLGCHSEIPNRNLVRTFDFH